MELAHCLISIPSALIFEGVVCEVKLQTTSGEILILPHHENIVTTVGVGLAVVVDDQKVTHTILLNSAFVVVENGQIKISAMDAVTDLEQGKFQSYIERYITKKTQIQAVIQKALDTTQKNFADATNTIDYEEYFFSLERMEKLALFKDLLKN